MRNRDQWKYGSLTTGLSSQYYTRKNQYPANVTYATDTMNNHCSDNYRSQVRNSHNSRNEIQNTKQKPTEKTNDTISVITDTSFAQMSEVKCYCCGKSGHYSNTFR